MDRWQQKRFEKSTDRSAEKSADKKGPEDLPIYPHREAILQHVREHRVTHIQGETGCGKSTQVPKYIMEEEEARRRRGDSDGKTKIVVTQPRRMAAITLARRVATELGEDIGKTVGYKISGDSVSGSKLSFATTGFLLQVLVNQPEEFGTYTHVILDEVHERSVDADLLTMLLKLLLQCYPHVKLIVMSATLQAKLFAEYFKAAEESLLGRPLRGRMRSSLEVKPIFVGVRTFPVQEIFLDEIDDHFEIQGALARRGMEKALRGFSGLGKGKGGGKGKKDNNASGFKRLEPQITEGFDELCKELVQQMAREMCTLIVFLPGIADITSFYETLACLDASRSDYATRSSDNWRDTGDTNGKTASGSNVALKIFPMHSLIPREEQEEVFNPPPRGVCHVVLASNIAESSLTLPSVCGIVDMALRRSIQYDARRLMSCLVTTWCSQSSCRQRAGRAGRTMPGQAIRMVTRNFFDRQMVEFDPPEMLNAPLTKLYLQAKQLCFKLAALWDQGIIPDHIDMDLSTPTLLLGQVVQPPSTALVSAAITELADVGCIDSASEYAQITPLGYIAMALPCELRLCRLLYFGLMLGCPADAVALVVGLTAADPFSTPSLIVLKDEKEYCKKLERSFAARKWFDAGRHSEPMMIRSLFQQWITGGAPRGPRAMGQFAKDWSIIPKKFESLVSEAVDLCSRLCKLLNPRSDGHHSIQQLLATMRYSVDKREELVKSSFPSQNEYDNLFTDNIDMLRGLLCAAFSDQIMLSLKPRWVSSGGKKKKEEVMLDIMRKQGLNYTGSICFLNPPAELREWDAEENHQKLSEAMCGERAKRVHWEEKEKLLFFDFKDPPQTESWGRGRRAAPQPKEEEEYLQEAVIKDVCKQVHRLHQFGAGRWKFTVENPIAYDTWNGDDGAGNTGPSTLEILKPLQPFLINWEVLQHSAAGDDYTGGWKKPKKPASVKAMPDWRNPCGFACHADDSLPAQELIGVCASVQGLESGGSAFVAGATILGLNHFPLLLSTLDPRKWQVQWGYDLQSEEVRVAKILHHELQLPPGTLTADVLWKVNQLRNKILESLTPWEDGELSPKDKKRRGGQNYIWVGDMSHEFKELLDEIWPTPDPVTKPKKMAWCSAVGYSDVDPDNAILLAMQPLAEEFPFTNNGASSSKSGKESKSQKEKNANNKASFPHRKGVQKEQAESIEKLRGYLWTKGFQSTLSDVCGRFKLNKKVLLMYPDHFKVSPIRGENEEVVKLIASDDCNGWGSNYGSGGAAGGGWGATSGAGLRANGASSAGKKSDHGRGDKSSAGGRDRGGNSNLDLRIGKLCKQEDVACRIEDFDVRVKSWIRRLESRRGFSSMEALFDMLDEWCSRKERDDVKLWPAYIMRLMANWEREQFPEEAEGG